MVKFDSPNKGMKTIIRIDTNQEVETVKMQPEDMQEELPIEPKA